MEPNHAPVEEGDLRAEREMPNDWPHEADEKILPVVGLGGSAGSIGALQQFFGRIPSDLNIAYVVVVHLAPDFESQLAPVLQARTRMKVVQVQNPVKVEPNCVYVIPPAHHLAMHDGHIELTLPQQDRGKRVAVDLFFRTLATSHRSRAVAVVLSGLDGDGAIGIKRIKEHGGVTIAQDPDEAEYDSMPRSAIATGMVDWILSIEAMTAKISEWISNENKIQLPPSQAPDKNGETEPVPDDENALKEILGFVLTRTGHDFSHYKRASVLRRIQRRLQVNCLETLPQYADFLRTHPGEAGALLGDLLISVTNFFRDPQAFRALNHFVPGLFRGKKVGEPLRVWVAGCATGEEAYSLAMLLLEYAETLENVPEIQIFATDLDENALRVGREGLYSASIAADVSPERLRRFFVSEAGRYRVKKEVRERILFAPHNLLRDSPFSRLDLVSCRNLMIYFDNQAQNKVLDVFHFALKPGGLLLLGGSESADNSALFASRDKKHRLYERQNIARPQLPFSVARLTPLAPVVRPSPRAFAPNKNEKIAPATTEIAPQLSSGELHLKLLEQVSPPSILVDGDSQIVHLSEGAGQFLRFVGGEVSTNLLAVVHPALRLELRTALFRAFQNGENVDVPTVALEIGGETRRVGARVRPMRDAKNDAFPNPHSNFALVIFAPADAQNGVAPPSPSAPDETTQRLEAELEHLKSYLREAAHQYETSAQELKASNEELQALNEEQHSAAEELETSREEIQAANEELSTVNAELKSKIEEVARTNADLGNLMASTEIATVFLNRDLQIMRYTPRAVELFRLIPGDFGRPLADLTHGFEDETFAEDAERVLQNLAPLEREVQTTDGEWFLERISPYRTAEDKIDGVVLTFVNITARKKAEESAHQLTLDIQRQLRKFNSVVCAVPDFIYTFDLAGRFSYSNPALLNLLQKSLPEVVGKNFHELDYPPQLATKLQNQIQQVIESRQPCRDTTPFVGALGARQYEYIFVPMFDERGEVEAVAGVTHDITEITRSEANLRASEERLRLATEAAMQGVWDTDYRSGIMRCSLRMFEIFGLVPAPDGVTTPETFQRLVWPADLPFFVETRRFCEENQRLLQIEHRIVRADTGEVRWLAMTERYFYEAGELVRSVGNIYDITERKHNEEALKKSEERLRIALEGAELGTCEWNYADALRNWDEQHFRLFGMEKRSNPLPSEEFWARIHPDDVATLREQLRAGVEEIGHYDVEFRVVRENDGAVRWMNNVGRVVERDGAGMPTRISNIVFDITARREAEEILRRDRDELEWRVSERTRDLGEALQQLRAEIVQRMQIEIARRDLLKRLVNAQEDERRRISRELHDNLGQHLTAIMLGLQALKNGCEAFFGGRRQTAAPNFEALNRVVDQLMQAAHRQAWELRPAELDDMGLEVALRHFTNDWSQRTGISLDFHANGWENARPDSEIETALYRVVQEALTNVARHAGATGVSVVLELNSANASAIIEDDGRGFEPTESENNGRLGLLGMRERLALVQGTLDIESSPEAGTTLYARVPVAVLAHELQIGASQSARES